MAIGFVDEPRRVRLARFRDVFEERADGALTIAAHLRDARSRSDALEVVARTLADEGALTAWRSERYAVAERFDDAPLFTLERAAARYFGIMTYAAHVNGVARTPGAPALWFARRSPTKPIDPGRLDNLVGGGIAAGESPAVALVREAWEEAGIEAALAREARPTGILRIERCGADGFHRETIHVYDLALPDGFVPANQDGEAVEHRCVGRDDALRLIALDEGPDVVTVDASFVVLDWLARHAVVPPGTSADALLRTVRTGAAAR